MYKSGLLIAVALLSGCATLFSEGTQQVRFTSNVEGAEVILDGQPIGRTPLTHTMDRSTFDRHIVVIRSEGYQSKQFEMNKGLNTVALINLSSLSFHEYPYFLYQDIAAAGERYRATASLSAPIH